MMVDFDFFARTPRNMTKGKALARALARDRCARINPRPNCIAWSATTTGFKWIYGHPHGSRTSQVSGPGPRSCSIGGVPIVVASLAGIIKSKRAAVGREKSGAGYLEKADAEATSAVSRARP